MKIMRILLTAVLGILLVLPALPVLAREEITRMVIEVDIAENGEIEVTERISVRAEGARVRRGIYRDFPTTYQDGSGNRVVVDFAVLGVERDGEPEEWFTEDISNGVRINTGGDDLLPGVPRVFTFTLRYRTNRQLGFFANHDELYWNAIGTGWDLPILAGAVTVRLPEPVPVNAMSVEGYTGRQGAKGQDYRASLPAPGTGYWELTRPLQPREGMTIVITFPKGIIPEPSETRRMFWLIKDNLGLPVSVLAFAGMLWFLIRRWYAVGRDPKAGVIITQYEPPADHSPAELRYLRRYAYDARCFTSDLLTGAVGGAVELVCEPRLLGRDKWSAERRTETLDAEPGIARELLEGLLPTPGSRIEFGDKDKFRLRTVWVQHGKALEARMLNTYFRRNHGPLIIAGVITGLTLLVAEGLSRAGSEWHLLVVLAMGLSIVPFAWLMRAPTAEGRKLLDHTEGFRRYLSVAERDELAALGGPGSAPQLDATRYQQLLPYAIALEVEDAWTDKFTAAVGVAAAAEAMRNMHWQRGGDFRDLNSLTRSVGSSLNQSIAASAAPPGSSSGSGGGGSSGGGGGGGGGGGR